MAFTECKIAIEGVTASEAVFRLNVPIINDLPGHGARPVSDRAEIGLLGIEIARAAGVAKFRCSI